MKPCCGNCKHWEGTWKTLHGATYYGGLCRAKAGKDGEPLSTVKCHKSCLKYEAREDGKVNE